MVRDLHERVSGGDKAALDELAQHLLPVLTRRLRYAYRRASADVLSDACEDAILEYGAHPHRFDPARGVPLDRFLQHAAARNLTNLLEADTRRRSRETRYAEQRRLELAGSRTFGSFRDDADTRRHMLSVVHDGSERKAFIQWLDGERSTAALAVTLKLSHLSQSEQRREVKRFKDRILKRLSRLSEKSRRRK